MQVNFKVGFRPGKYHGAADATSRLPEKAPGKENEIADVDDNLPTYCIVGPISESNNASKMNKKAVQPLPTTTKIRVAQAHDTL